MLQIHKYSSVDTELGEHDLSPLLPMTSTKLVYNQWKMDPNDELLIDGYYRECKVISHSFLPYEIRQLIISYYLKKYSKGSIKRRIHEITQRAKRRKRIREKLTKTILRYLLYIIIIIGLFGLILGPDIAGLVIVNANNCNVDIDDGNILINLGVNEYLRIGSIIHIVFIVLSLWVMICERSRIDWSVVSFLYFMTLFFISWSVVGAILYSEITDESITLNQQCSDIVISWVVLKLIFYGIFMPIFFCWIGDVSSRIIKRMFVRIGVPLLLSLLFFPDIAGLVIISINDCDLTVNNGSDESILGITNYLLIGCILHIVASIIHLVSGGIAYIKQISPLRTSLQAISLICTALFFIAWCIIGVLIVDETNLNNKQCKDMLLSWVVLRFIECIALIGAFVVFVIAIICMYFGYYDDD